MIAGKNIIPRVQRIKATFRRSVLTLNGLLNMLFSKDDLVNVHYNWVEGKVNSRFTGEPGRVAFDRFDGNQVLYIINCFGSYVGKLELPDGRKLENLILNQLPSDVKSELSVFNWLKGNYLYYWDQS